MKLSRRDFLKAAALLLASGCLASSTAPPPKNVILILADDLGYNDTSLTNPAVTWTPNIKALATGGRVYHQTYTSPVCTPTRHALMTGLHPALFGIYSWHIYGQPATIPAAIPTLAEKAQAAGYQTAIFGKWHLGGNPLDFGFDEWFGAPQGNGGPVQLQNGRGLPVPWPDLSLFAGKFTDAAVDFIGRATGPFFLYLAHVAPHAPLYPSQPGVTGEGMLADAVWDLDQSIKRIRDAVDAAGIADNTIIVFMSDNGGRDPRRDDIWVDDLLTVQFTPWAGHAGYEDVLNPARWEPNSIQPAFRQPTYGPDHWATEYGGKGSVYEGGVRVQTVVWGLGTGGDSYPHTVMQLHAALAGVMGGGTWSLPIASEVFHYDFRSTGKLGAFRAGRWKLHFDWQTPGPLSPTALYDLWFDQAEATNLVSVYPGLVETLADRAAGFNARDHLPTLFSSPVAGGG